MDPLSIGLVGAAPDTVLDILLGIRSPAEESAHADLETETERPATHAPRRARVVSETFIPSPLEGQDMSDRDSGEDLSKLVAELVTSLEAIESELDPPEDRPLRPPTPSELRLFASDVAIPGLILVLESNIRALRLLQRALQLRSGADRTRRETVELGDRARDVSETTLERLDDALVDLQDAVEERPNDDEVADLLADARDLRSEVQTRLREYADDAAGRARESSGPGDPDDGAVDIAVDGPDADDPSDADDPADSTETAEEVDETTEDVAVDVDAELESIKRDLDGNGAATGEDAEVSSGEETDADGDDTGSDPPAGEDTSGDD